MNPLVTTQAPAETLGDILATVNGQITAFDPFKVNISNGQASGLRTMSEGREGIVRQLHVIAVQNINDLSRSDDPEEMGGKLDYFAFLESSKQAIIKLEEMIVNTQTAVGADLMDLFDRYCQQLQVRRNSNSTLDNAMQAVDDYNKRFGGNGEETPPANPA
ncbi:MAG TPA: hypothetical protein VN958_03640 [Chitinophagaceae bacterium]|nr:hypothetical protein [Chitinophagaceae bacterium]